MNKNSKITVAIASCLLLAPAVLAGAWFSGCKVTTWRKWDQNTGFNNNQKKEDIIPMCVIPGYYYEEPNDFVPSCTGRQFTAGLCDEKSYGWHCSPDERKGWGTERKIKGKCYKQFNADGTERHFYVPCTEINFVGDIKIIKAHCDGK